MKLRVLFLDGTTKTYDASPLPAKIREFEALKDVAPFSSVQVDTGGYGVSWNDDLDLSSEELWENAKVIQNT